MTVDTQDWMAEAVRLRREEQMPTGEIAEAVGRSPSRVRRVLAEANAARFTEPTGPDRVLSSEEASEAFSAIPMTPTPVEEQITGTIPGQTTVDDFTSEEPAPEDDPDPDYDKDAFTAEAGVAGGPMPPVVSGTYEYEMESAMPVLKGTRQMALDLGPNAAPITESTVTFKSEKWPSGHFGMGDVVSGTFTARINSVPAKEKFDKDAEEFVATPMAYGALITEIEYEVGDVDH